MLRSRGQVKTKAKPFKPTLISKMIHTQMNPLPPLSWNRDHMTKPKQNNSKQHSFTKILYTNWSPLWAEAQSPEWNLNNSKLNFFAKRFIPQLATLLSWNPEARSKPKLNKSKPTLLSKMIHTTMSNPPPLWNPKTKPNQNNPNQHSFPKKIREPMGHPPQSWHRTQDKT